MIIQNCNNIKTADIALVANHLNIKYAANGTGKSTIARAIELTINSDGDLKSLTPFRLVGKQTEHGDLPSLSGIGEIQSVAIFNDSYVEQFVFKKDEVLTNSFQIFVKNSEYDARHNEIETALSGIKEAFASDASIETMLADLTKLISGFGKPTKKSSFSAASQIGKGIASGNPLENIPTGLEAYADFLKSTDNVKWIKWQVSGTEFVDVSDSCPFCTAPTKETKQSIRRVSEEFDAKSVEHLSAIIDVIDELSSYFTVEANKKLKQITTNKATISDEENYYLGSIRDQAEILKNKLLGLQNISFFNLKDGAKTGDKISALKIDISCLPELASDATKAIVGTLNGKLDEIANEANQLQGKIKRHQTRIAQTIEGNTSSINEFLHDAGYKYRVRIEEDAVSSTYKMKLDHEDLETNISDGKQHLSFGERNAFALVLFMHEVLASNPDLIILDDPISSFDDTKKFAISKRLFSSGNSFRKKTVLLLTHDFEPIVDAIYVLPKIFENVQAFHIANEDGQLVEKQIMKDDILSFPQLCMRVISSDLNQVIKAIYLRRYYEILDNKADEYQVLSSLLHGRPVPNRMGQDQSIEDLAQSEILAATAKIKELYPDFSYEQSLLTINSTEDLIALYKASESNYLKLQIFRMLNLPVKLNAPLMKHINETFHIENEYVMQVDPNKYQIVPSFIVAACDAEIAAFDDANAT